MFSWLAVTYLLSRLKINLSILQLVIQTNENHKILFLNFFFQRDSVLRNFNSKQVKHKIFLVKKSQISSHLMF